MSERLSNILGNIDKDITQVIKNCQLVSLWEEVVDERVKKHTEAVKVKNKTLYVQTSTSTWAQELSFLKRDILKKLNKMAGDDAFSDIRFKSSGRVS